MQYSIDYQFMHKGSSRPSDDGDVVNIRATDQTGTVILPNVGDFVHIDSFMTDDGRARFSGKVRSRLFSYFRTSATDVTCNVNIVVEDTDEDWGALIKE